MTVLLQFIYRVKPYPDLLYCF